jgi:hypothetical protein
MTSQEMGLLHASRQGGGDVLLTVVTPAETIRAVGRCERVDAQHVMLRHREGGRSTFLLGSVESVQVAP